MREGGMEGGDMGGVVDNFGLGENRDKKIGKW